MEWFWHDAPVTDDQRAALKAALAEAGVKGADDLGRFMSNTEFFRPSEFDEKAAMPVLLDALPTLSDPAVVTAVAGHLRVYQRAPRQALRGCHAIPANPHNDITPGECRSVRS